MSALILILAALDVPALIVALATSLTALVGAGAWILSLRSGRTGPNDVVITPDQGSAKLVNDAVEALLAELALKNRRIDALEVEIGELRRGSDRNP